jgi:tetratricopeptide (TPR) repeat protein
MLRLPGKIQPRRDEQTLVSTIDLAPTILAACGISATKEMRARVSGHPFDELLVRQREDLAQPSLLMSGELDAPGEARDQRLHALDYLEYAYLQSGQVKQARAALAEMNALPTVSGLTLTGDYALAAVPARAAIELGNWEQASALKVREGAVPWAEAITWAAIGEGSARSGNLDRAAMAEQKLAALRDVASKQNNVYWSNQIEVQRREVAAWIAEHAGKKSEAIVQMQSAAELEESMDKNAVTPGAVTPAREMLAELLLLESKPQESLSAYEAVLKVAPNRFNALYGAARAAESSGKETVAKQYIQKLSEISPGNERPKMPAKIASSLTPH